MELAIAFVPSELGLYCEVAAMPPTRDSLKSSSVRMIS